MWKLQVTYKPLNSEPFGLGFENVSDSESDNSRAGSKKKIKLHKLEKISDDELSDVGSDEVTSKDEHFKNDF